MLSQTFKFSFHILFIITMFYNSAAIVQAQIEQDPPFKLPNSKELNRLQKAVIMTSKGDLLVQLYPQKAPWHVANLKYLADQGFYEGLEFHIYEPNYLIQTGAPGKSIASGPGYSLPPEFSDLTHSLGSLSMVRKPNDLDLTHNRRSHGSQFRLMLGSARHMDGTHTIFGKVIEGIEVLEKLRKGDHVKKITVFVRNQSHK